MGIVEQPRRGVYALGRQHLGLPRVAAAIVKLLERSGTDAHLTGLDFLLPYAHQLIHQYPHLVYADPADLDSVEFELSAGGYVVSRSSAAGEVAAPDLSRLVILRGQPNAAQYGVDGHVASREKAWVDLLRETNRGTVPFAFAELGRMLRNLLDSGADFTRLRQYARRLGYLDWLTAATTEGVLPKRPEMQQLRAGYRS